MRRNHLLLYIAILAGLLSYTASPASAQSTDSGISIDLSAKVVNTIEMITIQSMNLGKSEARNGIITINPLQSANAGKMVAIGTPNTDIRISFLEERELTQQQGSGTLLFEYKVAGNARDDQSTSEILDRENRDFKFNEEGRFYLWIGGSVDISTAAPGNYQGEFTLDIDYI